MHRKSCVVFTLLLLLVAVSLTLATDRKDLTVADIQGQTN